MATRATNYSAAVRLICAILLLLVVLPPHAVAKEQAPIEAPVIKYDGPAPPWKVRRRVGVAGGMKPKGQGLIDLKRWPSEPDPPPLGSVDPEQFAYALRHICHDWMPPKRPLRYTQWILEYAAKFEVDPFLLAALVYRQSRCLPRQRDNYGAGLTKINIRMHAPYLKKRTYRYWVLEGGGWAEKHKALPDYAFVPGNMRKPKANLYFSAALLSIYKEQCPKNDGAFGSVPHRHPVSHLVYGDKVLGAGPEDRILRARRRLLEYYLGAASGPVGKHDELPLYAPLGGMPRKVTSSMGRDRSEGARRHKGVDFGSTYGEPVFSVADGRISVAGLDRPSGKPASLTPEEAAEVKSADMGPGGLFVMIRHAGGLLSAYMHLSAYVVNTGDRVKAGQIIGFVGRSGIKQSGAHLHFELRHAGRHIDPETFYEGAFFTPRMTYRGNLVIKVEKRKRRRRRIERYRARAKARDEIKPSAGSPATRAAPE